MRGTGDRLGDGGRVRCSMNVCPSNDRHGSQDTREGAAMILLRRLLGDVLRRQRQRQGRTLREVSAAARVSLGYLSEVERGQKEASSELLASICDALDVPLSELMFNVATDLGAFTA